MTGIPTNYCLLFLATLGLAMHAAVAWAGDEQQALENPRVIVHENLDELPDVQVVSEKEESGGEAATEPSQRTPEELEQIQDELDIEATDSGHVLVDKSNRLMEISRLPLTYIQKHVPALTKRHIIGMASLFAPIS